MAKYEIKFYENSNGISESYNYIQELVKKSEKSKDARIKLKKITEYMRVLSECGSIVGEPYVKHIEGVDGLYELRPLRDRFFFVYEEMNSYIIIHHFVKSTQKTPQREIETAIRIIKERNSKKNENLG